MIDIRDVFETSSTMVDTGEVDDDLLEGFDVNQLQFQVTALVSRELLHMTGLSDDPDSNEEMLRGLMVNAANKAFFAGLMVGKEGAIENAVVVEVPEEVIKDLTWNAAHHGVMTLVLTTPREAVEEDDTE